MSGLGFRNIMRDTLQRERELLSKYHEAAAKAKTAAERKFWVDRMKWARKQISATRKLIHSSAREDAQSVRKPRRKVNPWLTW